MTTQENSSNTAMALIENEIRNAITKASNRRMLHAAQNQEIAFGYVQDFFEQLQRAGAINATLAASAIENYAAYLKNIREFGGRFSDNDAL